jgi:anti-sigma factor RsiW
MISCEEVSARIAFYLDDELRDGEQAVVELHVEGCKSCRDALNTQRQLIDSVRAARPLYEAPAELRAGVENLLKETPEPFRVPPQLRRRIQKSLWQSGANRWQAKKIAAVALIFAFAAIATVWRINPFTHNRQTTSPSEFALMAVATHNRHQRKMLPLEIQTASAEAISQWFAGKVSFSLTLPNYQELSGQEKLYTLEGARLVGFKNDYAAYVAYEMNRRPISLVVTSYDVAQPSGGEEIPSRGLTFHYDAIDNLKVITWSDRGLTYALVSDLAERGQQSCMVCHIGTKDRNFLEDLKPKLPEN